MKPLLLTLALLRAGDLATSQIGLRSGLQEWNPLQSNRPTPNLLIGSAETVGEIYLLKTLSVKHPKAARWISILSIGVEGFAVAHNTSLLLR